MEIRVLVPTDRPEEKFAHRAGSPGGHSVAGKLQRQFIAAVDERQRVVPLENQFVNIAISSAPAGRSNRPSRLRKNLIIIRRERFVPGQVFELTEAAPVQIRKIRGEGRNARFRIVALLKQSNSVPMNFERRRETQLSRIPRQFAGEVDDDALGFAGGCACDE